MKNLISCSGKINSGKDTVCSIIQYLVIQKETGITESFEKFRGSTLEMLSPYQNKKMAGKLKQVASILTGIPVEKFEDQEFKKTEMSSEWGMTYRTFLQKLGTEAIRNGLHEDTWLNAFWIDYKPFKTVSLALGQSVNLDNFPIEYPNWIITDVRFENEYNSVKERGGLMIKVERPGIETQSHASETGLDDITDWDWVIHNDGTIEDLISMVKDILEIEKII